MAITTGGFFNAAKHKTGLRLVCGGEHLARVIHESALNRPGLALAGFYRHFAFRRVQVLGMAENEYLAALESAARAAAVRGLFERHIPCLVVCRNRKVCPEIIAAAGQCRVPVFRSPMVTGAFINKATMIMEDLFAPTQTVQGTMVDILGIGVLIEGRPGIGKSEAALALVQRGYSLVADDLTFLRRHDDSTIIGASTSVTRYHMEIRGLGIVHVPSLFGVPAVRDEKNLDLIVTLQEMKDLPDRGLGLGPQTRDILGVPIPHLTIPVASGRELATLIETASLNEKLKRLGHDAAKELDQKMMLVMSKRNLSNERID